MRGEPRGVVRRHDASLQPQRVPGDGREALDVGRLSIDAGGGKEEAAVDGGFLHVKDDRVDFHYKLKRKDLFKNITVDQAQWINGWLSRLSDRQIEDAFRAANYSPEEVRMMSRGVRARIGELNGVRNTLASRMKH